uniref:Uncharacterized protein n=1 Tax=viral metagenome TaxID=1070528 RepID=A0A6C0EZA8_9ZZZZ
MGKRGSGTGSNVSSKTKQIINRLRLKAQENHEKNELSVGDKSTDKKSKHVVIDPCMISSTMNKDHDVVMRISDFTNMVFNGKTGFIKNITYDNGLTLVVSAVPECIKWLHVKNIILKSTTEIGTLLAISVKENKDDDYPGGVSFMILEKVNAMSVLSIRVLVNLKIDDTYVKRDELKDIIFANMDSFWVILNQKDGFRIVYYYKDEFRNDGDSFVVDGNGIRNEKPIEYINDNITINDEYTFICSMWSTHDISPPIAYIVVHDKEKNVILLEYIINNYQTINPQIELYNINTTLYGKGKYLSFCSNYNVSMFSVLLELPNEDRCFYTGIIHMATPDKDRRTSLSVDFTEATDIPKELSLLQINYMIYNIMQKTETSILLELKEYNDKAVEQKRKYIAAKELELKEQEANAIREALIAEEAKEKAIEADKETAREAAKAAKEAAIEKARLEKHAIVASKLHKEIQEKEELRKNEEAIRLKEEEIRLKEEEKRIKHEKRLEAQRLVAEKLEKEYRENQKKKEEKEEKEKEEKEKKQLDDENRQKIMKQKQIDFEIFKLKKLEEKKIKDEARMIVAAKFIEEARIRSEEAKRTEETKRIEETNLIITDIIDDLINKIVYVETEKTVATEVATEVSPEQYTDVIVQVVDTVVDNVVDGYIYSSEHIFLEQSKESLYFEFISIMYSLNPTIASILVHCTTDQQYCETLFINRYEVLKAIDILVVKHKYILNLKSIVETHRQTLFNGTNTYNSNDIVGIYGSYLSIIYSLILKEIGYQYDPFMKNSQALLKVDCDTMTIKILDDNCTYNQKNGGEYIEEFYRDQSITIGYHTDDKPIQHTKVRTSSLHTLRKYSLDLNYTAAMILYEENKMPHVLRHSDFTEFLFGAQPIQLIYGKDQSNLYNYDVTMKRLQKAKKMWEY